MYTNAVPQAYPSVSQLEVSHLAAPLKAALRHAARIWEAARSSTWWAAAAPVAVPRCLLSPPATSLLRRYAALLEALNCRWMSLGITGDFTETSLGPGESCVWSFDQNWDVDMGMGPENH